MFISICAFRSLAAACLPGVPGPGECVPGNSQSNSSCSSKTCQESERREAGSKKRPLVFGDAISCCVLKKG